MYSFFVIIGSVEDIAKNEIVVKTRGELIRVNTDLVDLSGIELEEMVAVKGRINSNGLCCESILTLKREVD